MSNLIRLIAVACFAVALFVVIGPGTASAHERRPVGKYVFVIGFLTEPAIQNQPNGLDLTITDTDDHPVEGAEKSLKFAIAYGGGASKDLPIRARFGQKGKYTADFIPTRAGAYSFTFSGTINGEPVNERFESGPGRFNDVESPTALQFPDAVPAPADVAKQAQSAQSTAEAALQRASLFGLGGIAVGLVGLSVGVIALITRARSTEIDAADTVETPS